MQIIYIVKIVHPELRVRVSFIGYDDIEKPDRLQCVDLSSDLMRFLEFMNGVSVQPRSWQNETLFIKFDDKIKDFRGAMKVAVSRISWKQEAVKMVLHLADKDYFRQNADREYFASHLASDFDRIGIHYTAVRINDNSDKLLHEMRRLIGQRVSVVDVSKTAVDKVTMALVEGVSVCIKGVLEAA